MYVHRKLFIMRLYDTETAHIDIVYIVLMCTYFLAPNTNKSKNCPIRINAAFREVTRCRHIHLFREFERFSIMLMRFILSQLLLGLGANACVHILGYKNNYLFERSQFFPV